MIRLIVFVIAGLASTPSGANELCSEWEKKIEPDMQIQESDFTLERFDKALKKLSELGRTPTHTETWITQGNSLQFVRGWLLKKAALESLNVAKLSETNEDVDAFCDFLVNHAFYYD